MLNHNTHFKTEAFLNQNIPKKIDRERSHYASKKSFDQLVSNDTINSKAYFISQQQIPFYIRVLKIYDLQNIASLVVL